MINISSIIKQKRIAIAYVVATSIVIMSMGIAYAAFLDKGKVLGSTFSVGSSDLKILENLTGGTDTTNLKDEINGPSFINIQPNWTDKYLIKLYNNSTSKIAIGTNSNYETINDPDDLRGYLFVEPVDWVDTNNNGIVDEGEEGVSYGKKTITKWKTEGYDLGTMERGETKGLILKFSAESLSDTKQGKTGIFDFEFSSANL